MVVEGFFLGCVFGEGRLAHGDGHRLDEQAAIIADLSAFRPATSVRKAPERQPCGENQLFQILSWARRRATACECSWHTRDSDTPSTAPISFRFMSCS